MPVTAQQSLLLLYAALAVVGLVILIARLKMNAFVALIVASIFVGFCSGMSLGKIATAFQEGVGAMLGSIAAVIGLGTILGKLLAESGGAEVIAATLIRALGEKRLHWTMMLVAFLVGIPVFFAVGLVLLVPILFTVARDTKLPLVRLGIPLLAGLSVAHGLVPPHPGPMVAIGIVNANTGRVIFYSLLIGLPTAIVAGPLFGKFMAGRVSVPLSPMAAQLVAGSGRTSRPSFGLALFTILLPVLLMLLAALADLTLAQGHSARDGLDFLGSPMVAMLVATLFGIYSFGFARGFNRGQILKFSEDCLAPAAMILLVVGAGGGFSRVLIASGVGEAIASIAKASFLSPLLLGWLVAVVIRIATGSATVAITTAAGIVTPFAKSVPGTNLELLVIAMGAGSLILSHLNDGGFWFVKEYFGMSVAQTLQTWTMMETIISVVAMVLVLALDLFV